MSVISSSANSSIAFFGNVVNSSIKMINCSTKLTQLKKGEVSICGFSRQLTDGTAEKINSSLSLINSLAQNILTIVTINITQNQTITALNARVGDVIVN